MKPSQQNNIKLQELTQQWKLVIKNINKMIIMIIRKKEEQQMKKIIIKIQMSKKIIK